MNLIVTLILLFVAGLIVWGSWPRRQRPSRSRDSASVNGGFDAGDPAGHQFFLMGVDSYGDQGGQGDFGTCSTGEGSGFDSGNSGDSGGGDCGGGDGGGGGGGGGD